MSWTEEKQEVAQEVQDAASTEDKVEEEATKDVPEDVKEGEAPKDVKEEEPSYEQELEERQKKVGRAFKAQREQKNELKATNDMLRGELDAIKKELQEIRKSKSSDVSDDPESEEVEDTRSQEEIIAEKVKNDFLARQQVLVETKYGKDNVKEAIDIIGKLNNAALVEQIQSSANAGEELMYQAALVKEKQNAVVTPVTTEIMPEALKQATDQILKNLQAQSKQPLDMQKLRKAGGDVRAQAPRDTWSTGKTKIPG